MRKYLDADIVYETKDMERSVWLNIRKSGIGGSDAASVLGLNPYKSSVSIFLEKVDYIHNAGYQGEEPEATKDEKVSYRMELGKKLEEFVAREFTLKTGKKVRNVNGVLKNEKYPFAIANIDRAVVGEKAFLECKVTNSFSKKVWEVGVPIHYQIQVNHYMAVTGATHCYVAALVGNEELVIHRIDRDEEVINEIMKLEAMFWDKCVLGDNIPAPDGSYDYSKVLQEYYKDSKDEEVILFEQDTVINRYDEINQLYKEIDLEKKKIEQHIQNQMKEYEVAFIGDRRITWKKQERKSIDSKRLKEELPEIAEKYMKTTTSRVFRI
ncbi:YqaJ viral recombinase family protein [Romboutsia sp.]|uniref:YqaJ viral recombinase family nuclease n=1 Tax=Romboutsia sp. TaxID=1965302 RepID=UPI003F2D817C